MPPTLPAHLDPRTFDEVYRLDSAAWRDAIVEVCARHGLPHAAIVPFTDGLNLVAEVDGRWVVKVFPTFHRDQWESERRVLPRFHGALPIPVPELVAEGEREDGWLYVVVTRLPGRTLEHHWSETSAEEKARLLEQIGATMAAAHWLPVGELISLPPRWEDFLAEQVEQSTARHTRLGMPDWFVKPLERFVRKALPTLPSAPALLTGEYTPFNLLAARSSEGLALTGMIDFGDAMVGPAEYDLLGPSLFLAGGDPTLVRALLRGYFGRDEPMSQTLRRTLMVLFVLHRYSSPDRQLRLPGWRARVTSLEELELLIWPRA